MFYWENFGTFCCQSKPNVPVHFILHLTSSHYQTSLHSIHPISSHHTSSHFISHHLTLPFNLSFSFHPPHQFFPYIFSNSPYLFKSKKLSSTLFSLLKIISTYLSFQNLLFSFFYLHFQSYFSGFAENIFA